MFAFLHLINKIRRHEIFCVTKRVLMILKNLHRLNKFKWLFAPLGIHLKKKTNNESNPQVHVFVQKLLLCNVYMALKGEQLSFKGKKSPSWGCSLSSEQRPHSDVKIHHLPVNKYERRWGNICQFLKAFMTLTF